jgi:hypothetical protein
VSKKHSPTGERHVVKLYPTDNEPRTFGVRGDWLDAVAEHIKTHSTGSEDLLFAAMAGTPISRSPSRTRVWLPAVTASGVDFNVRSHTSDTPMRRGRWLAAQTARA